MALPVRDGNAVGIGHDGGVVVHGLVHLRVGRIDVFAIAQHTLQGEVRDEGRYLETELHTDMTLIDAAHGEVRHGVLGIIVETHHLGLVLDGGVVTGQADVVAVRAELVIHIAREDLGRRQIGHHGVAGTRRHKRLVEMRGFVEVTATCIEAVTALDDVIQVNLSGVGKEFLHLGCSVRGNRLSLIVIRSDGLTVPDNLCTGFGYAREKALADQAFPPERAEACPTGYVGGEIAQGKTAAGP